MSRPFRGPLLAHENDAGVVLRDPASGSEHHLNPVAALIWRLCDGTRKPQEIVREVASAFDMPLAAVSADVDAMLARFVESRIVRLGRGPRVETELIVRCLKIALGSERGGPPPGDLRGGVNWSDVAQTALQHGVIPLVARHLRASGNPVSGMAVRRLDKEDRANARWSRVLVDELLSLLAAFEMAGIRAVPLKGPLLAALAYGDVSLRQFGDLDILVPPNQAARAQDLLKAEGYRFRAFGETDAFAERCCAGGIVGIDLQWALGPRRFCFPFDLAAFWERIEPTALEGTAVWQPAPADHVMFLCAHGAKHCWSRLLWITDVAFFTRMHGTRIDWLETLERARRRGGARMLLLGLRLASDVLGAPVPVELLALMRADRRAASLATELRGRLFEPIKDPQHFQGSVGVYRGAWLYVGSRERVSDKLPYAFHALGLPLRRLTAAIRPSDRDRAAVALPRSLAFLYYLVRPLRVAHRCVLALATRHERVVAGRGR